MASVPVRPATAAEEDVAPVASSLGAEDGPGREGTCTLTISDQSFRLGSRDVWTRKYPSVAMLATRRPWAGSGGPNWTERIAPVGPVRIPRSSHAREVEAEEAGDRKAGGEREEEDAAAAAAAAAAVEVEKEGSSQIRIVRSCEHEARREPWIGCEKERWRMGASWACAVSEGGLSCTHLPVGVLGPFAVLVFPEDLYALVGGARGEAFAVVVVREVCGCKWE